MFPFPLLPFLIMDDVHHPEPLQVAVVKEELLGDRGYEEIHCQVDYDGDDYAGDVDGHCIHAKNV